MKFQTQKCNSTNVRLHYFWKDKIIHCESEIYIMDIVPNLREKKENPKCLENKCIAIYMILYI